MSLIKLQGNASGTGAFTIAAPNGNTDRTLTLPDATGTVNVSGLANEVPAGSAGAPAIYPTGDTNTGIFFPAADTIAFAEGGVESMRIDSDGNLLIKTTTSVDAGFSVQMAGAGGRISAATLTNSNALRFTNTNTASQWSFGTNSPGIQNAGDYMAIGRLPSGGSWAEALRIDSAGDLLLNGTAFGNNQYTYKKMMQFSYPPSGQFGANQDSTDFRTAGSGSLNQYVQMRLTFGGNLGVRGGYTSSATLNDYAEYFEWEDGNPNNEDRTGMSVVMSGKMIRLATEADAAAQVIGVVSGTAGVALGAGALEWSGKFLRDELGRQLTQDVSIVFWTDESGDAVSYTVGEVPADVAVPENAQTRTYVEPILNPDYDPDTEYVARMHRKEWAPIGLVGQLRILKGQVTGDRWIKMRDVSETVEEWLVR